MTTFNRPVSTAVTTNLSGSGVLASEDVKSLKRRGRHTITVSGAGALIGNEAEIKGGGGFVLPSEPVTIPVITDVSDDLWYSGSVTLTEWF
jgi:hypothetical protein